MAPITPTRSSSKAPVTPRQSTLRRKRADDSEIEGRVLPSVSTYTLFNPFVPGSLEASQPRPLVEGEYGDVFYDKSVGPTSPSSSASKFEALKPSATTSPSISTLRRKTAELFSSSKSAFDTEDEEGYEQYPSLRPSTLRRKTGKFFASSQYLSNPFDPEDSELDEPFPRQSVRSKPLSSLPARASPIKHAEKSVSLVSAETGMVDATPEKTSAAEALAKMHLATPVSSPGLSTLKRRSADLFAREGYFASSAWDEENVELTQQFESMRLDSTQHGRGLTLKSLHKSQSPSSTSALSAIVGTEDQDHDESRVMSRTNVAYRSWPDKKDLEANIQKFTANRGTFKSQKHSPLHSASSSGVGEGFDTVFPIRGTDMTEQEHDDFLHELLDKECGNPTALDAHDKVIQQFYRRTDSLQASNPAGFPHLIDYLKYTTDADPIVKNARPRLADAVATTLFQTSHQCLADFLNPGVQVFEWRRNKQHMMIRREGKHVIVGMYQNYGTCYVWNHFVRSEISETGAWKEAYAGASQVITPVSARGIEFDKLVPGGSIQGIDPTDEKYALYVGRVLGQLMLKWEVWDFSGGYLIEWEADGVVRNAREVLYEGLRTAREETEED